MDDGLSGYNLVLPFMQTRNPSHRLWPCHALHEAARA